MLMALTGGRSEGEIGRSVSGGAFADYFFIYNFCGRWSIAGLNIK
jgi:hypothetical protein